MEPSHGRFRERRWWRVPGYGSKKLTNLQGRPNNPGRSKLRLLPDLVQSVCVMQKVLHPISPENPERALIPTIRSYGLFGETYRVSQSEGCKAKHQIKQSQKSKAVSPFCESCPVPVSHVPYDATLEMPCTSVMSKDYIGSILAYAGAKKGQIRRTCAV